MNEREEDELDFDEEFPEEAEAAEFMVLAKVHTAKPFSRTAVYDTMKMGGAWPKARPLVLWARTYSRSLRTVWEIGNGLRSKDHGSFEIMEY